MSVFEQPATEQNNETAAPEATEVSTESFVSKLVEERGDKWSDPEVIAKGKLEADTHIGNLERQLSELREDLAKNEYAKQVLDALQNKAGSTTLDTVAQQQKEDSAAPNSNTTGNSDLDMDSLVEQALAKRELEAKVSQNLKQVEDTLEASFGTEAQKVVLEKAQQLGMSLDRFKEIATESPNAFLTLIGQPAVTERNADLSSAKNTVAAFSNTTQKDFDYYQDLRRKNPNQYYSPRVQNEMAQSRVSLGDKFYRK